MAENNEKKRQIYRHKVSKLQSELDNQLKRVEGAWRSKLQMQRKSAELHKNRADNMKETIQGLTYTLEE